ncbi:hypothetical protein ACFVP8_12950 [Viridibacillus arvi]|uniref:hypothetical protein n=1 Tax=Viridibacillus arvi TaxID=263475 RepID=UPI003693D8DC
MLIAFVCLLASSLGTDVTTTYAKSKPVTKDFLMDKNKTYTFKSAGYMYNPYETLVFEQRDSYRFWRITKLTGDVDGGYEEKQSKNSYTFHRLGMQKSATTTVTTKPVKGKKYTNKYGSYVVVSTNATVKTKYKTFKNCMVTRVKEGENYTFYNYYAPHHGLVKAKQKYKNEWFTTVELIKVSNE